MAFKLPMDGFKKVSEDKHKTVLKHEMGHEITIAHAPLSGKMRSQLKALPMVGGPKDAPKPKEELLADGGQVSKPMVPGGPGSPAIDPQKAKQIESSANESGWQPGEWKKNVQAGLGLAEGGEVPADDQNQSIGSIIGHAVRTAVGDTAAGVKAVAAPVVQGAKDFGNAVMGNDAQAAEVPAPPQQDPAFAQAQAALTQAATPSTPTAQAQQTPPDQSSSAPASPTQAPTPQEPGEQVPGLSAANQPGLEEGYKNQVLGEQGQAQAIGAQGNRDAANFQAAAQQEGNLLDQFNTHSNNMNTEISNFMSDINAGHIDPHQLWDNKSGLDKARTGIGIILSGLGSGLTGGPNLAVEMLNKNIDRDIDAQKANLGKKENLLGAMFKQYGNMRDATDMTRVLMNSHNQDLIKASAAKAQSPLAKAAAQQAVGKLQDAIAPTMYQMNMRRTLMGIGQGNGNLSNVDPATFLNMVPDGQRKAVGDEIERAQNTHNMAGPIMQHFDAANHALSGLGAAEGLVRTPRELNALSGLLNTTVTDLTGTARQAEFDNIQHNFIPSATDTQKDVAIKRQALQQYLQAKSSAPLFKSYTQVGLDKFQGSNNTPQGRLTPQQQSFAQWAQANPGPKADMVLKKLGLK